MHIGHGVGTLAARRDAHIGNQLAQCGLDLRGRFTLETTHIDDVEQDVGIRRVFRLLLHELGADIGPQARVDLVPGSVGFRGTHTGAALERIQVGAVQAHDVGVVGHVTDEGNALLLQLRTTGLNRIHMELHDGITRTHHIRSSRQAEVEPLRCRVIGTRAQDEQVGHGCGHGDGVDIGALGRYGRTQINRCGVRLRKGQGKRRCQGAATESGFHVDSSGRRCGAFRGALA